MSNPAVQGVIGIQIEVDAGGMVTGSVLSERALGRIASKAKQVRQTVRNASADMGEALQQAAAMGIAGGAAIGVGRVVKSQFFEPVLDQARSFQVEMAEMKFATQASMEEMAGFETRAKEVGLQTQFSPQEAAAGMNILKKAGLDNVEMLKSLNPALDVATGSRGALGLEQAANATATSLMKFKHTGESSREMMDSFAHATRLTKLQFQDLPIVLNSLRTAPQLLKLTTKEAWALVGVMKNAGMSAAESGQAINGFANNLFINQRLIDRFLLKQNLTKEEFSKLGAGDIKKGRGFQRVAALKKLGLELFNTAGKMKEPKKILNELLVGMEGLDKQSEKEYLMSVSTAFTAQAKTLLVSLHNMERGGERGKDALNQLFKEMDEGTGASREMAAAIEGTLQGLEKFIEGTKDTIKLSFGQQLLPMFKGGLEVLKRVMGKFLDFIDANPAVVQAITAVATVVMVLSTALGGVLLAMAAVVTWSSIIQPALIKMGMSGTAGAMGIQVLQRAMVGLRFVARTLIGTLIPLYLFFKIWQKIADPKATGVWKVLQDKLKNFKVYFGAFMEGVWIGIERFIEVLVGVAETASDFFGAVFGFDASKSSTKEQLKQMSDVMRQFGEVLGFLVGIWLLKYTLSAGRAVIETAKLGRSVVKTMIEIGATTGPAIGKTAGGLMGLAGKFKALGPVIGKAGRASAKGLDYLAGRIVNLAAKGPAMFEKFTVPVAQNLNKLVQKAVLLASKLRGPVAKAASGAAKGFVALSKGIVKAIVSSTVFVANSIKGLIGGVVKLIPWLVKASAAGIKLGIAWFIAGGPIVWLITLLAALAAWTIYDWDNIKEAYAYLPILFGQMWEDIKSQFAAGRDYIVELGTRLGEWAGGIWDGFVDGLSAAWEKIKEKFTAGVQWIRDMLPGSDAKIGPLSNITASGTGLATSLTDGFTLGIPELLNTITSPFKNWLFGPESVESNMQPAFAGAALGATSSPIYPGSDTTNNENFNQSMSSRSHKTDIKIEKIELHADKATPQEADRFAKMIVEKLRTLMDDDNEVSYR